VPLSVLYDWAKSDMQVDASGPENFAGPINPNIKEYDTARGAGNERNARSKITAWRRHPGTKRRS
jgi:hypothetical protein